MKKLSRSSYQIQMFQRPNLFSCLTVSASQKLMSKKSVCCRGLKHRLLIHSNKKPHKLKLVLLPWTNLVLKTSRTLVSSIRKPTISLRVHTMNHLLSDLNQNRLLSPSQKKQIMWLGDNSMLLRVTLTKFWVASTREDKNLDKILWRGKN